MKNPDVTEQPKAPTTISCSDLLAQIENEIRRDTALMKGCANRGNGLMKKFYQGRVEAEQQMADYLRSNSISSPTHKGVK